ncbi:MAG: DUF1177 domain-containing protein [Roseibium sp.]|uniref:DUF1177 domain-containing protein n=1 Tax=Roseibium sp. TaxID=1936156 RepID=UPI00262A7149|nr:DUF1177 domain-containing protein [Roseibium sp.]MCV0426610.1 DUF1177 domain-containing protein [Roseibium sp.]
MLKQTIEIYELLDRPDASAASMASYLEKQGPCEVKVTPVSSEKGKTDYIRIVIPGGKGASIGGKASTLGVIGRLGGLGARPEVTGFVSDGDGALAALALAAKLTSMAKHGDCLDGDVIVSTHICPSAPTRPHSPVPFMDSPVDPVVANRTEVLPEMDAILSIDTTKGNRILNHKGVAITPTVKDGYILRVSERLLDVLMQTTGRMPRVLPITQQDLTPYGNGLFHINSILQPSTSTDVPVVGVAVTTETTVAGCATGATDLQDVEGAARFCLEVAKTFTAGNCEFFDNSEYERIIALYGKNSHFREAGNGCR